MCVGVIYLMLAMEKKKDRDNFVLKQLVEFGRQREK